MEIPDTWAVLVLSAVNDSILHHEKFLSSETIADKTDYEDYLMQLSLLLEYLKEDYRKRIEPSGGMPLNRFLPEGRQDNNVVQLFEKQ